MGGHYISDKWDQCEDLEDDVLRGRKSVVQGTMGPIKRFGGLRGYGESHRDSKAFAQEITDFYDLPNHHRNVTSLEDRPFQNYYFSCRKNKRPTD